MQMKYLKGISFSDWSIALCIKNSLTGTFLVEIRNFDNTCTWWPQSESNLSFWIGSGIYLGFKSKYPTTNILKIWIFNSFYFITDFLSCLWLWRCFCNNHDNTSSSFSCLLDLLSVKYKSLDNAIILVVTTILTWIGNLLQTLGQISSFQPV